MKRLQAIMKKSRDDLPILVFSIVPRPLSVHAFPYWLDEIIFDETQLGF